MNAGMEFIGKTATELVLEMEPPRLQAVLRMTETRVRGLNASLAAAGGNQNLINQNDLQCLLRLAIEGLAT